MVQYLWVNLDGGETRISANAPAGPDWHHVCFVYTSDDPALVTSTIASLARWIITSGSHAVPASGVVATDVLITVMGSDEVVGWWENHLKTIKFPYVRVHRTGNILQISYDMKSDQRGRQIECPKDQWVKVDKETAKMDTPHGMVSPPVGKPGKGGAMTPSPVPGGPGGPGGPGPGPPAPGPDNGGPPDAPLPFPPSAGEGVPSEGGEPVANGNGQPGEGGENGEGGQPSGEGEGSQPCPSCSGSGEGQDGGEGGEGSGEGGEGGEGQGSGEGDPSGEGQPSEGGEGGEGSGEGQGDSPGECEECGGSGEIPAPTAEPPQAPEKDNSLENVFGEQPTLPEDKTKEKAKSAGEKQAREDFNEKAAQRSEDCEALADDTAESVADNESVLDTIDTCEDCCNIGNPNNPEDNANMQRAKDATQEQIDEISEDVPSGMEGMSPEDAKEQLQDRLDDITMGPEPSESRQKANECTEKAQESMNQEAGDDAEGAQDSLGEACDALGEALEAADTRQDYSDVQKAAEKTAKAASVLVDDETTDLVNDVIQEADQQQKELKYGIEDEDGIWKDPETGDRLEWNTPEEAQEVIDDAKEDHPEQDWDETKVVPLSDPIADAMDKADMGDLDQSDTNVEEAFREGYEEETDRLEDGQLLCTIINLNGTYAKSEWPDVYKSVATWIEITDKAAMMVTMMTGQEPEHKRTNRVKVEDYIGLYQNPITIKTDNKGNWNPESIPSWLDESFGLGSIVTVIQDLGNYVVVRPPSAPETRVDSVLLPKSTLDCYQIEEEEEFEPQEFDPDIGLSPQERRKRRAEQDMKRRAREVGQRISSDPNLETRVDFRTGEVRQFTGAELLEGAAGRTFLKTSFATIKGREYAITLPGLLDLSDDVSLVSTILETSSEGYPLKVEVDLQLLGYINQMGRPLKVKSEGETVVVAYR